MHIKRFFLIPLCSINTLTYSDQFQMEQKTSGKYAFRAKQLNLYTKYFSVPE